MTLGANRLASLGDRAAFILELDRLSERATFGDTTLADEIAVDLEVVSAENVAALSQERAELRESHKNLTAAWLAAEEECDELKAQLRDANLRCEQLLTRAEQAQARWKRRDGKERRQLQVSAAWRRRGVDRRTWT